MVDEGAVYRVWKGSAVTEDVVPWKFLQFVVRINDGKILYHSRTLTHDYMTFALKRFASSIRAQEKTTPVKAPVSGVEVLQASSSSLSGAAQAAASSTDLPSAVTPPLPSGAAKAAATSDDVTVRQAEGTISPKFEPDYGGSEDEERQQSEWTGYVVLPVFESLADVDVEMTDIEASVDIPVLDEQLDQSPGEPSSPGVVHSMYLPPLRDEFSIADGRNLAELALSIVWASRGGRSIQGVMKKRYKHYVARATKLGFASVADRYEREPVFREQMRAQGWDAETIIRIDLGAKEELPEGRRSKAQRLAHAGYYYRNIAAAPPDDPLTEAILTCPERDSSREIWARESARWQSWRGWTERGGSAWDAYAYPAYQREEQERRSWGASRSSDPRPSASSGSHAWRSSPYDFDPWHSSEEPWWGRSG